MTFRTCTPVTYDVASPGGEVRRLYRYRLRDEARRVVADLEKERLVEAADSRSAEPGGGLLPTTLHATGDAANAGDAGLHAAGGPATGTRDSDHRTSVGARPFVLGTVLYGNRVQLGDTLNPQWNDPELRDELGIQTYPPYAEASGYAMSAVLAAYLARAPAAAATSGVLRWRTWAVEDSGMGVLLAGLDFRWVQLPIEVRRHIRVVGSPRDAAREE